MMQIQQNQIHTNKCAMNAWSVEEEEWKNAMHEWHTIDINNNNEHNTQTEIEGESERDYNTYSHSTDRKRGSTREQNGE